MNLRRDPLGEHMRCWVAHWLQPDARLDVRASGTIAFPEGCGVTRLAAQIGDVDSQAYVPASGPVVLPTADSMARNRAAWTRMRRVG